MREGADLQSGNKAVEQFVGGRQVWADEDEDGMGIHGRSRQLGELRGVAGFDFLKENPAFGGVGYAGESLGPEHFGRQSAQKVSQGLFRNQIRQGEFCGGKMMHGGIVVVRFVLRVVVLMRMIAGVAVMFVVVVVVRMLAVVMSTAMGFGA